MSAHWFDRLARSRAVSSQAGIAGSAGLTRRDAKALALTVGELMNAVVLTENFAIWKMSQQTFFQ